MGQTPLLSEVLEEVLAAGRGRRGRVQEMLVSLILAVVEAVAV